MRSLSRPSVASKPPNCFVSPSPIRKRTPLGPYRRNMCRAIWWSEGEELFLIHEQPQYSLSRQVFKAAGNRVQELLEIKETHRPYMYIGGLVGLALKVHLTQARGTLSMGPHVYARHA